MKKKDPVNLLALLDQARCEMRDTLAPLLLEAYRGAVAAGATKEEAQVVVTAIAASATGGGKGK